MHQGYRADHKYVIVCRAFAAWPPPLQALGVGRSFRWGERRALVSYYRRQNDIIDSLLEMDDVHSGEADFDRTREEAAAQRALKLSFASNVLLLGIRVGIAVIAASLSLIVATIDAFLDVLSSCIMFYCAWAAKRVDRYRYPVGRHRLEPLGIIVFSTIMYVRASPIRLPSSPTCAFQSALTAASAADGSPCVWLAPPCRGTAALTVVIEGIKQLVAAAPAEALPHLWIVVGGSVFVVLMKAALWLYCRGSPNAAVQAFATDHLNDVLVNSFSLAGALLGADVAWWLDPAIAIAISFWVLFSWGRQGLEHVVNLVGVSAPPEALQRLTYLAASHCPGEITHVDTVRAYTIGSLLLAEVDIVVPEAMPLRRAHDIGEELQRKLESLPEVGRAFVHLDIDTTHAPEH
jgi:divalent metal cation (Fe/Co/Zn/Cd) transporter